MTGAVFPKGIRPRVLAEDARVIVIDKPHGVSLQSGGSDDLLGAVRADLLARGEPTYLASHVPIDRDASGATIFLRRKEDNAPFLAHLQDVETTWVAIEAPAGKAARRVDLTTRGTDRGALSRLRHVVGRDGAPHHRALVHAARLRFRHPATGDETTVECPLPPGFLANIDGSSPADDSTLLREAAERRQGRANEPYRLVNDAGDGMPDIAIDVYGQHAVLSVGSEVPRARETTLAAALTELGALGVYVKRRPRQASTLVDTRRDEIAPSAPIAGAPAPDPMIVEEDGDRFLVRLGDGLSTGIFLDQRENRRRLRALAKGRSVLNLFAYACAFTTAAARAGASRTVSVDISRSALAWGEDNLSENGITALAPHAFVVDDAERFLARARARKDLFDIIILDPPSFATTKTASFSVETDLTRLVSAAFGVLAARGHILVCTNHRGVSPARFRRMVESGALAAGRGVAKLRELGPPPDFPPPPGSASHLKTILLEAR